MITFLSWKNDKYYFTKIIDDENPQNNFESKILISEYKKKQKQLLKEMRSRVKIGNYYSFDGIEYAKKIETQEDVRYVLSEIGEDGLCDDVWSEEEFKSITKL